jgi:hypothetical protein
MPSFDDSFPGTRLPSPATNLLYVGFMDRSVKKSFALILLPLTARISIARYLILGAVPRIKLNPRLPASSLLDSSSWVQQHPKP